MKKLSRKQLRVMDNLAIDVVAACEKYMTEAHRLGLTDPVISVTLPTDQTFVYTRHQYNRSLYSKAQELNNLDKE